MNQSTEYDSPGKAPLQMKVMATNMNTLTALHCYLQKPDDSHAYNVDMYMHEPMTIINNSFKNYSHCKKNSDKLFLLQQQMTVETRTRSI